MYVVSKRNRIVKPLRIGRLKRASKANEQHRSLAQNDNNKPEVQAEVVIEHQNLDFETIVTVQLLSQQITPSEPLPSFQTAGIDAYQSALDRKVVRLTNGTYYKDQA